jgi:shikimate kinase
MNLIVIYGAPATGKLTVAEELLKLINYRLIHNHLTIDLARNIIDPSNKDYWKFLQNIRVNLIKLAIKNDVNLIITGGYSPGGADIYYKKIIKLVKKSKGNVYFVHLYCYKEVLFKRVKGKSRRKFGKIRLIKQLKKDLKIYGHINKMKFINSFDIDNTKLSPKKAALLIKKYYKLK